MTLQTFDGYDPKSPTLKASPLNGTCLWGMIPREFVTAYVDRNAAIRSGDYVRAWVDYGAEVQALLKRLVVSRAGTWWLLCSDGAVQLGTLVRPFNIERVVAFSTEQLVDTSSMRPPRAAAPEEAAHYAMLAQEMGVTEEWATLGHIDGVPFPGLDVLNYFVPGTIGTRNPYYKPPRPL